MHVHVPADSGAAGLASSFAGFGLASPLAPPRRRRPRSDGELLARAEGLLDPGHARPRRVPALRAVQEHPGRRGRRRQRAPARPRRARLVREADHPRRRLPRDENADDVSADDVSEPSRPPFRRWRSTARPSSRRRTEGFVHTWRLMARGQKAYVRLLQPLRVDGVGGDRGAHPGRTRVEAFWRARALQARVRGMSRTRASSGARSTRTGRAGCAAAARGEPRHRAGVRARGRARGGGFFTKRKNKKRNRNSKRETRQKVARRGGAAGRAHGRGRRAEGLAVLTNEGTPSCSALRRRAVRGGDQSRISRRLEPAHRRRGDDNAHARNARRRRRRRWCPAMATRPHACCLAGRTAR